MIRSVLSLCVLLSYATAVYAMNTVNTEEWKKLRAAVVAKLDPSFGEYFDRRYPDPSENGVRVLAGECDNESHGSSRWFLSTPRQLMVKVNGIPVYGIHPGRCAQLICATLGYEYTEL